MIKDFLPISRADMEARGWDEVDFVYVIGDAYVDHPSFGHAIISRILEANNYRVGIISQPDWKNKKSIDVFGRPRLGFIVTGGNMDSMSTTTPSPKNAVITMPLHRAVSMENGRTMRRWSTAT